MKQPLRVERGSVVVSVGCGMAGNAECGTAGNAESGTAEINCGTSRKACLSWSILSVCTHLMRSRVKYLSFRLRTLYGPLYGQSRGNW